MSDPTTPTPAPAYAPTPAAAGLDPSKWLPIDRLSKVVGERDALQVTLEAQTNETDIWREKAATADTLAGQLESMKAAHATEIGAWETKGAANRPMRIGWVRSNLSRPRSPHRWRACVTCGPPPRPQTGPRPPLPLRWLHRPHSAP